jgi:hypothetical protein
MSEKLFCQFCGKEIQADSAFCPHCGKPVPEAGEMPASISDQKIVNNESGSTIPPPAARSTRGRTILLTILGLALVFCLAIIITSQVIMPLVFHKTFPQAVETAVSERSGAGKTKEAAIAMATQSQETAIAEATQAQATAIAEATQAQATAIMEATLDQEIVREATMHAGQTQIIKRWTFPLIALITVEMRAEEMQTELSQYAAKELTLEEMQKKAFVPDTFDLMMACFDEQDTLESTLKKNGMELTPAAKPFYQGLKDDYEKLMYAEIYLIAGEKDVYWAIDEVTRAQEALEIEGEKFHQAMLMDGFSEDLLIKTVFYIEGKWPEFKAKMDATGIKLLTPQP